MSSGVQYNGDFQGGVHRREYVCAQHSRCWAGWQQQLTLERARHARTNLDHSNKAWDNESTHTLGAPDPLPTANVHTERGSTSTSVHKQASAPRVRL